MKKIIFLILIPLFFTQNSLAEQKEECLETFFSIEQAQERLKQINSALEEFREFTEIIRTNSNLESDYKISALYAKKIPDNAKIIVNINGKSINKYENLNWDMQNLGFFNWHKYTQGFIDYQNLIILNQKLEISNLRKIDPKEITKIEKDIFKLKSRLEKKYLQDSSFND